MRVCQVGLRAHHHSHTHGLLDCVPRDCLVELGVVQNLPLPLDLLDDFHFRLHLFVCHPGFTLVGLLLGNNAIFLGFRRSASAAARAAAASASASSSTTSRS